MSTCLGDSDVKLYFPEGKYYNRADIMTEACGNKSDAKNFFLNEQIEEFIRHKQGLLKVGCERSKAISAAKGSFQCAQAHYCGQLPGLCKSL